MYVNTGGGGKTQQQQPLQNQTNVSVRHNNPYPNSHTQHQPHYEHHQGPVTFLTFPMCNVAPATHGTPTGNNVNIGGGQPGHVLYQAPHQSQTQPLPTQQQIGIHSTEQTLHYFQKSAPMPTHHLHHTPQPHTQIRNMIAVSHQRQQYMVQPNYFAFSPILSQQTRPSILANAAPQHAIAASGASLATQIQNTTPRNIAPSGPTAYGTPPFCNPSVLLSAAPTAVASQPAPMLTAASGIGQQPPSLQGYAHMSSGLAAAPNSSTSMNIENTGLAVGIGTASTAEHNTNTNKKQRIHAIPIRDPITLEIVQLDDGPKTHPQTQMKSETSVESVSIQTDNEKSLTVSISSEPSEVVLATRSESISATETDKINIQIQNQVDNYDNIKGTSGFETTFPSDPNVNTTPHSVHSESESLKICAHDDQNDTDADTNEHELDNEDDVLDGNLPIACIDQESQEIPKNISIEHQTDEIPNTDVVSPQVVESDTDYSKETEVKSKDEPYTVSSFERNDVETSKDIQQDVQPPAATFVVSESKRKKNQKAAKSKEKNQKKSKQHQNKSRNLSTQNETNNTTVNLKTASSDKRVLESKKSHKNDDTNTSVHLKSAGSNKKVVESKNLPKIDDEQPAFKRYTLKELKALSNSPESRKTPLVSCQKGDCISQLFVACQQYHPQNLSHQGQNLTPINLHHVQQSYHQMNFNESMEFVTGKRRTLGGGVIARKHQDNTNIASTGSNNNGSLQTASGTAGISQIQKKMQVIRINLSLNEEIKLSECKNAWQPKFLSNNSNNNLSTSEVLKNANDDLEDVLKQVRGILNKLTSENFDVLLKEMTTITINTAEKMEKIMLLIFEKTVSEPNFAPTYAKFCKVLFDEVKAEKSKNLFNKLLIKRLETEFELNVNNADAKEKKLEQIIKKLNDTTDPQEKIELQAELEHQEYQFRRRAWGTVRFIGELFKLHSLSANRVFLCVESLLEHGNEEKLEYMCKLLTTVGNLLESSGEKTFTNIRMNTIFDKIVVIVKGAKDPSTKKTKICSRVRFMMQDLIDLRSKNWGQPNNNYAQSSHIAPRRRPSEEKNSNLPSSSANSYERSSSQRMSFGNNNRQNQSRVKESGAVGNSDNYLMQKSSKSQYLGQREQHSIDLKKLNFSRGDDSSQATTQLGNSSNYVWRTVTGRQTSQLNSSQQNERTSPTSSHQNQYQQKHQQPQQQRQTSYWGNKNPNLISDTKTILESCSGEDNKRFLNRLMEEYLDSQLHRSNSWQEEVAKSWEMSNNNQHICLVYYILTEYLHLGAVKALERNACANIFIYLMNRNSFDKVIFTSAYEVFAEDFPDLLVDVPNGLTHVFQFIGPLLHEHLITFSDIWHRNWCSNKIFTERFINALVAYFTKEFGATCMRNLWHKEFKLDRGQIFKFDQQQWRQFVTSNKLQFLYDCKAKPEIALPTNADRNSETIMENHVQRLEVLLSSSNDPDLALDYIHTNVNINSNFLKKLTKFLCCDYATRAKTTTMSGTSRASSSSTNKNSSTCSNTNAKSKIKCAKLNTKEFRENCVPLLLLCLDGDEDHDLACLDSVVDAIQQEYDTNTANELICGIFEILYDCETVAKESFEKWYKQRLLEKKESKNQINQKLCSLLKLYMQKLLLTN